MQQVKNKDSKIEVLLRKELWSRGLRYRKNVNRIYGKPDIVFIGKKIAVFCDSEFWHGKNYQESTDRIGTNSDYWKQKIKRNMERDIQVTEQLQAEGWIVLRFWEKDIKKKTDECVQLILNAIAIRR